MSGHSNITLKLYPKNAEPSNITLWINQKKSVSSSKRTLRIYLKECKGHQYHLQDIPKNTGPKYITLRIYPKNVTSRNITLRIYPKNLGSSNITLRISLKNVVPTNVALRIYPKNV